MTIRLGGNGVWNSLALTHEGVKSVTCMGRQFLQKRGTHVMGVPTNTPSVVYMVGFVTHSQLFTAPNAKAHFMSYQICVAPVNYVWEGFCATLAEGVGSPKFFIQSYMGGLKRGTCMHL